MFNFLKKNKPEVSPEYQNWRKLILGLSSTGVLKGIPDELYCILMDVGMGDGKSQYFAISMYANNDGETSLKASSGAGVVGLGGIQEISKYPDQIIQIGQSLLHLTSPTKVFDYPEANKVFFYFLTTSGIRVYKCGLSDIRDGHPFSEIFSRFSTIKGFADRAMEQQRKKST
jgi:hypothetical protein